jgi:CrcB protein
MQVLLSVAAGGAVGAVLRYFAMLAFPMSAAGFPMAIFFVNVIGSALLGLAFGWFEQASLSLAFRTFLSIGVLGALTTFSTFSADTIRLIEAGQIVIALFYVLLSVTLAILSYWAALSFARYILS